MAFPRPPLMKSANVEDLILYFYATPYGEESTDFLVSSLQREHYDALPWNVQWRVWCRRSSLQGAIAHIQNEQRSFPLEPLMAQLQACLLSQKKQHHIDHDDNHDLFPLLPVRFDQFAWQNDCMLREWNRVTHYHVLRDLQRCSSLLSREQQRDATYIVSCIQELMGNNKTDNTSGVSWEVRLETQEKTVPLPRATLTLDEIMAERERETYESGDETTTLPTLISPQFQAYVQSKMEEGRRDNNQSMRLQLCTLWNTIGRAPRGPTAAKVLDKLRSLSVPQRHSLLSCVVNEGRSDPPNSDSTRVTERRGHAWMVASLVEGSGGSSSLDLNTAKIPFAPFPHEILFYASSDQQTSLLTKTQTYLQTVSCPNISRVVMVLWGHLVRRAPDKTNDDILSVVRACREWLPATHAMTKLYRSMLCNCFENTMGWQKHEEVQLVCSSATEFVSALVGEESSDTWGRIFDRQFCTDVLLPLRQRLCMAICTNEKNEKDAAVSQSRLLLLILKRLLMDNTARRQSILRSSPHVAWVLHLFGELPVSREGVNLAVCGDENIGLHMKQLFELSCDSVALESMQEEGIYNLENGPSAALLPRLHDFVSSILSVSESMEDSECSLSWTRHVSHLEFPRYHNEAIHSQWIEMLVMTTRGPSQATQSLHQQVCRRYWGSEGRCSSDRIQSLAELLLQSSSCSEAGSANTPRDVALARLIQCTPPDCLFAHCSPGKIVSILTNLLVWAGCDRVEAASVILSGVVVCLFRGQTEDSIRDQCYRELYDFLKPDVPDMLSVARSSFDRISSRVNQELIECDCLDGSSWWRAFCTVVEGCEFPPTDPKDDTPEIYLEEVDQHFGGEIGNSVSLVGLKRSRPKSPIAIEERTSRRIRASVDTVILQVWGEVPKDSADRKCESDSKAGLTPNLKEVVAEEGNSDDHYEDYDEDNDTILLL